MLSCNCLTSLPFALEKSLSLTRCLKILLHGVSICFDFRSINTPLEKSFLSFRQSSEQKHIIQYVNKFLNKEVTVEKPAKTFSIEAPLDPAITCLMH